VANPLVCEMPRPKADIACRRCRDFGYILPTEMGDPKEILAGVLFGDDSIRPCGCSAGREFDAMRREWRLL
jgi:hypothetical protein